MTKTVEGIVYPLSDGKLAFVHMPRPHDSREWSDMLVACFVTSHDNEVISYFATDDTLQGVLERNEHIVDECVHPQCKDMICIPLPFEGKCVKVWFWKPWFKIYKDQISIRYIDIET